MSPTYSEIKALVDQILHLELELKETEIEIQNTSRLKKWLDGGINKSRKEHLTALIKNKISGLNNQTQKYLETGNTRFNELKKKNSALLTTDQFTLQLLQKHDSILNVLADLNSIHEYYKTPSTFFNGNLNINGVLELKPVINASIVTGLPQRGMAVTLEGKIDHSGSSYIMVTETEPFIKPMMVLPFKYTGSISSEGEIKMYISEKVRTGTPLLGILIGNPFGNEKQKADEFQQNKIEMEKIREDLKKEMGFK